MAGHGESYNNKGHYCNYDSVYSLYSYICFRIYLQVRLLSATICLVEITFTEYSGNKYFADDILFEQRGIAVFTRTPCDNCYLHFLIVLEFWL